MKKYIYLILATVFCMILSGCRCDHEWQEAKCEQPKTCTLCGETEGEALGHQWQDADCEHPETCSRCGKTRGEALGHSEGDWVSSGENFLRAEEYLEKKCIRCGTVTETKTVPMLTLIKDHKIQLSLEQFQKRMDEKLDKILREKVHDSASSNVMEVDGNYYYFVEKNGLRVCGFALLNEGTNLEPGNGDCIDTIIAVVFDSDSQIAAAGIMAMAETLDPSFSYDNSAEFIGDVVKNHFNNGTSKCRNGISYSALQPDGIDRIAILALLIEPGAELYTEENMGLAQ